MNRKLHEFNGLTQAQLESYISRAQQARAEAIADAFIWLGRLLHGLLVRPFSAPKPLPRRLLPR